MKRILKYAFYALTSGTLLFIILLVISQAFRAEVFEWLVISNHQTSHPISREEASKYLSPDYLPASAHDIQFASYYCQISPAFEMFLRFEAPVQDCLSFAQKKYPHIVLKPITTNYQQKGTFGYNRDWFDTHLIQHGVGGGKQGEGSLWIDTDRGVFYFFDTD